MKKYICICGKRYFTANGMRSCCQFETKLKFNSRDTWNWLEEHLQREAKKRDMLEEIKTVDFS